MYSNGDDPLFTNAEQQPDKEPSTRSNSITPVEEPVEDPVEDPPEEPVELGKISAGICIVDIHFSSSELIECVRVNAFPHSVSDNFRYQHFKHNWKSATHGRTW